MKCPRSNNCLSYPQKCTACAVTSSAFDNYPYFVEIAPHYEDDKTDVKFKIFWGNHTNVSADVKLNQWLEENPNVELVDWQYQQVRVGDHTICISYKEKEK